MKTNALLLVLGAVSWVLVAEPAWASVGGASRPAVACAADGDCPPGYLCTSMVYFGMRIMPICIAGPTNCSSDADCPRGYSCDQGRWFNSPALSLGRESGSCQPTGTAHFGRPQRSSAPN